MEGFVRENVPFDHLVPASKVTLRAPRIESRARLGGGVQCRKAHQEAIIKLGKAVTPVVITGAVIKDRGSARLGGGGERGHIALEAGRYPTPFPISTERLVSVLAQLRRRRLRQSGALLLALRDKVNATCAPFVDGLDVACGRRTKEGCDRAAIGRHGSSAQGRGEEEQLGLLSARVDLGGEGHEPGGVMPLLYFEG